MTSKLKCPFCGEEIISDLCLMCDKIDKGYTSGRQIYKCNKCSLFGNKELWQALIQAKQDLEIAVDALEELKECRFQGGEQSVKLGVRVAFDLSELNSVKKHVARDYAMARRNIS